VAVARKPGALAARLGMRPHQVAEQDPSSRQSLQTRRPVVAHRSKATRTLMAVTPNAGWRNPVTVEAALPKAGTGKAGTGEADTGKADTGKALRPEACKPARAEARVALEARSAA